MARFISLGNLTEIRQQQIWMRQFPLGSVKDRQVLDRSSMAVLQSANRNAPRFEFPTSPDDRHGVGRCPAVFFKAIERVLADATCLAIRHFLDLKVFRLLFDVHAGSTSLSR